jgi:cation:H+ antiporter
VNALTVIEFVAGLLLLMAGAEILIRGASKLALTVGITPLVVGLTVVAFGTSSPELAVAVEAVRGGTPGVSNGNIVGSNIFNSLVILGLAALVSPLTVHREIFRVQVPVLIGASLLFFVLAMDGRLVPIEGILLFCLALGYIGFTVRHGREQAHDGHFAEQLELEPIAHQTRWKNALDIALRVGMIAGGLVMLVFGSDLLVESSVRVASQLGVSDFLIGVTVIAAGTSLPEVATTITAALHDQRDIAIGNAIGSSILNLLVVFGLSTSLSADGTPIDGQALSFDIPFMLACAVLLFPIVFSERRISRLEGGVLLVAYLAYVFYIVLAR